MIERKRVGVGIITCNRTKYLNDLIQSLINTSNTIDSLVIVNDGDEVSVPGDIFVIQNKKNIGVGASKNKALKYLLENNCDYIFILEDDVVIKDLNVFKEYIEASRISGIQHFNFGPGTPFNRSQNIQNFDLHNRHLLEENSAPLPRLTVEYAPGVKLDFYLHVAGVFSFFTKEILQSVGLNDEQFYNAWEHVDHTMRIIKSKGHPPFWWFADLHSSINFIDVRDDAIDNSTTSTKSEEWYKNVNKGREIYKEKHGYYPNMCPHASKEELVESLKQIKNKWTI